MIAGGRKKSPSCFLLLSRLFSLLGAYYRLVQNNWRMKNEPSGKVCAKGRGGYEPSSVGFLSEFYASTLSPYCFHFDFVVRDAVRKNNQVGELFDFAEVERVNIFLSLSNEARGLYSRIFMRKGPWFRPSSFSNYRETQSDPQVVNAAIMELCEARLLHILTMHGSSVNASIVPSVHVTTENAFAFELLSCINSAEVKALWTKAFHGQKRGVRASSKTSMLKDLSYVPRCCGGACICW